jgi:hypothetical protein
MPMSDGQFNRALLAASKLKNNVTRCEAMVELYETHRPSSVHAGYWRTLLDIERRLASLESESARSKEGYPGYG